ncbi:MAG: acyl-CoA dehydratase activase-related protein [bacterium]
MIKDNKQAVIGLDIGTVKIAWVIRDINSGYLIDQGFKRHNGNPDEIRKIIIEIKEKLEKDYEIKEIVATGLMSETVNGSFKFIPERAAQEEAGKILYPDYNSYNLLKLGGNGFSILTFENKKFTPLNKFSDDVESGELSNSAGASPNVLSDKYLTGFMYSTNDKCSSGTGSAIERLCKGRFGIDVFEACELAEKSQNMQKIAARCSVFVKSEITHLANQGYSKEDILASYFNSLAINIWALVKKRKINGKFILIGGVAKNKEIVRNLEKFTGEEIKISKFSDTFEAFGASEIALKLAKEDNSTKIINFEKIANKERKGITELPPLFSFQEKVKKYKPQNLDISNLENKEIIIGLDLGSTGSKIAIIDANTKELLCNDYLPTKGNPVGASQELIKKIPEEFLSKVCAIGITGSGRHTAATVLKAAYPEFIDLIIVKTEIIAHAKSAANFDDDNGKSLSVIEIGGQDAKYTYVSEGEVEDSIMNMACAAGTGSFLEEQGIFYGVNDVSEFGKMAYASKKPANLGQHCTVFVAELANKALQEGYSLKDIFAGFYYSVIYNYVNRVMGKRMFGDKIFLQGMPATHIALACALAGVTGKEVIVPPNPGAMGAIGIALFAQEEFSRFSKKEKIYFNLNKFLSAKVISRGEFKCENPKCGNLCRISTTLIDVGGQQKNVLNGGMCPKYEQTKTNKLSSDAPNPFKEREKLLGEILDIPPSGLKTVGIPAGLGVVRFLPLMAVFFRQLGFNVKILKTNAETMEKGDSLCSSYDTCAPIKIMHGLFKKTDFYFCPKIKALPIIKDEAGSCTCPLVQSAPDLIKHATGKNNNFLNPVLDFSNGIEDENIRNEFLKIANFLGSSDGVAFEAYNNAAATQKRFERELHEIGKRALKYAREKNLPVILICGRLYTICDPVLNSSIPQAIQESGAIALPIDCYPVREETDILNIMYWGEGQRNLRGIIDSFEQENIFPIWISNYICGPDSFLEHFFKNISKGYPHMNLETDGHSGVAGFITRIEAFLHTCSLYMGNKETKIKHKANIDYYDVNYKGTKAPDLLDKNTMLLVPPMGDGNEFLAAVFSSYGVNAKALPEVNKDSFMLGRKDCSGKECIPFLCVWGSIKNFLFTLNPLVSPLDKGGNSPKKFTTKLIFLVPTTEGPCRYCMYHIRIKQLVDELLKEMNLDIDIEFYSPSTEDSYDSDISKLVQLKLWAGAVSADLLHDMLHYIRPIAKNSREAQELYEIYKNKFIKKLEKKSSAAGTGNIWGLASLMKEVAEKFSEIEIDENKKNKIIDVLMAGEIYVREELFANDYLIEKLEKYGMRVKLAPFREWVNYVSFCENANLRECESEYTCLRRQARIIKKKIERLAMEFIENKLYKVCENKFNWHHDHKIADVVKAGYPYVGDAPQGEAILSIGAPILMYKNREIKGAVLIGPYGCMPTKIAEAQLNHSEIPFLAIFVDGEPIDESKIASFAWQLGGIDSLR